MMGEIIKELIIKYRNDLEQLQAEPGYVDGLCENTTQAIDHGFSVLNQIEDLVESQQIEKANRWLGFVQAMLFIGKVYSFKDINTHHWRINDLV